MTTHIAWTRNLVLSPVIFYLTLSYPLLLLQVVHSSYFSYVLTACLLKHSIFLHPRFSAFTKRIGAKWFICRSNETLNEDNLPLF